jgi:hypothetical protein
MADNEISVDELVDEINALLQEQPEETPAEEPVEEQPAEPENQEPAEENQEDADTEETAAQELGAESASV